jgi:hypothetical protein
MSRLVTKEELQHFSKIAADRYLRDKISMNQTINDLANDNQYLNKEHLKRIIEMSNQNVYQHLYDKEMDKNIHFDVASPTEVLKEDVEPIKVAYDLSVYKRAPHEKLEVQKVASECEIEELVPEINPLDERNRSTNLKDDIDRMKSALENAKEHLEREHFSHDIRHKEARYKLTKLALNYLESGVPLATVLHAISDTDAVSAKSVLDNLMTQNKVNEDDLNQPTKLGYFINPENELVKLAQEARNSREHLDIYEKAIKEANFQLELLKEAN